MHAKRQLLGCRMPPPEQSCLLASVAANKPLLLLIALQVWWRRDATVCTVMMPAEGEAGASGRAGRKSRANAGARLKDILQQEAKDLKVSSSSSS